ncbi:MAG: c-type cytochrome domain-containing protein, partial [Bacteroidota bacterium]
MKYSRLFLFLLVFFSLAACDKGIPQEDLIASQFPDDMAEIIVADCAIEGCHVGSSPAGDLNLTSWERMFEGSEYGSMVIPYNYNWSHLFQVTNTYPELG